MGSEVALDHVGVMDSAFAVAIDEAGADEYLVGAVLVRIEDARRNDELLEVLQVSVRRPDEAVDVVVDSGVLAVELIPARSGGPVNRPATKAPDQGISRLSKSCRNRGAQC